jgi:uncharacterized secreted protein with C-terminal beta-propeller domain
MKQKNTIIISLILVAIILSACSNTGVQNNSNNQNNINQEKQNILEFNSPKEMQDYILNTTSQITEYGLNMEFDDRVQTMADSSMKGGSAEGVVLSSSSSNAILDQDVAASEYSETNVQVEGIDEADFIKNDGKYIYIVENNKLYIIEAYPANSSKILTTKEFNGSVNNLFLNDNRLVVFSNEYEKEYRVTRYNYVPRETHVSKVHAYVFDITNKKELDLIEDYAIEGYLKDARMKGNYVYMITQNTNYNYLNARFPEISNKDNSILTSKVYYFPNPEPNYQLSSITAFNIFNSDDINSKSFLLGYSNNLYMSNNNIYISYKKSSTLNYYRYNSKNKFLEVVLPLLPEKTKNKIEEIKNKPEEEFWMQTTSILQEMYNSMQESKKQKLIDKISNAVEEYEIKQEIERRKTVIHRISIDKTNIKHEAKGEVQGYLLNQFSLDEQNEYLRVATTTYIWREGREVYNNLYVLNKDLNLVGEIEDIAPGERIYSTRFMGDKLYMVTFKNIDPFFVIDLKNPEKPKILGELKIPGYSSYLHPYSDNLIIGIGMDAEIETGNSEGVKISLFNVSNVTNPEEIDTYTIGKQGSYTPISNDHKAFLLSKENGFLVLPVREVTGRTFDENYQYYRDSIWIGAYVLNINKNGFELRGKVEHEQNSEEQYSYWNKIVQRSLFMNDVLYTVSPSQILMSDLNDLSLIKEIKLN